MYYDSFSMSSRKGADLFTSGDSQKQTSSAAKTKQKRVSNASDTPPGPLNLAKKSVKKTTVSQKTSKSEQKTAKTPKIIKKNEKDGEDSDEKKDLGKKLSPKQKLKEKLVTKTVKKSIKEVKKGKNSNSVISEKNEKLPPKLKKLAKKSEDKEEKKPKEKIQKEKKIKEVKKKLISKPIKKSLEEVEHIKSSPEIKPEKKDKPQKTKVITKNKVDKLNSCKKVEDNPPIECMDVVKDENPDDVALLQVFQLKNGPVCDFDGGVCNTITIRQDNTCIKIKEISMSQLPYPVKSEENEKMDVTSSPAKKELKPRIENQNIDKQSFDKIKSDKIKSEKLKNEKQKLDKQKLEKQKLDKPKLEKPKLEKQKNIKQKTEKPKIEKPAKKPIKEEKKKKPAIVDKTKLKGKTKVTPKPKAKGRPVAKRPRVASLNAIAKVHCLYENESKSALIDAMTASAIIATTVPPTKDKKNNSDAEMIVRKGKRTSKRTTPGLKSVGRHWDMHDTSSTNSSSSGIVFIILFNYNNTLRNWVPFSIY